MQLSLGLLLVVGAGLVSLSGAARRGDCPCAGTVEQSWIDRARDQDAIVIRGAVEPNFNDYWARVTVRHTYHGCLEVGEQILVASVGDCGPLWQSRNFLLFLKKAQGGAFEYYEAGEACTANMPWKRVSQQERIFLRGHTIPCGRNAQNTGREPLVPGNNQGASAPSPPPPNQPISSSGVDLTINEGVLYRELKLEEQVFLPQDCAVLEGCVVQPGRRKILRFSTLAENRGTNNLEIGSPTDNRNRYRNYFEYHTCHNHWHFLSFTNYRLLDARDRSLKAVGHKQSFCLMDSIQHDFRSGNRARYSCERQGITAGWGDYYSSSLDCQYIDVTDLAARTDNYILQVEIDPSNVIPETDESNNIGEVCVRFNPNCRGTNCFSPC